MITHLDGKYFSIVRKIRQLEHLVRARHTAFRVDTLLGTCFNRAYDYAQRVVRCPNCEATVILGDGRVRTAAAASGNALYIVQRWLGMSGNVPVPAGEDQYTAGACQRRLLTEVSK